MKSGLAVILGLALMGTTLVSVPTATSSLQTPQEAPPTVSSILAEARKLIDAGRPRAAVEKLQPLGEGGNPLVEELLGVACYHANDPAQAIEHLTPVVPRLPAGSL